MKTNSFLILVALLTLLANSPRVGAQGTAFTYQGRLIDNEAPANGTYDLQFALYDALANGKVGAPLNKDDVAVTEGIFTVTLDFEAEAFSGAARWLEIRVRPGDSAGDYTLLSPRQELTPTPYALHAAGFTGAVRDAQLSPNIPRLDANQTFTGLVGFNRLLGAPFAVGNSIKVDNLNADLFDGLDSSAFLLKAEQCLATIAELKAQDGGFVPCVLVLGYHMRGDGGGGVFYWDAEATELDNGGTVIVPNSNPAMGRWKRLVDRSLSVKWFGAKGDGINDDFAAIQATVNAGNTFFPPGTYLVSGITYLPSNRLIQGAGAASVLKRTDPIVTIVFFWIEGVSNVTIQRLAFDFNNAGDCSHAISFRGGPPISNVRILENYFFDTNPNTVTHCDKWATVLGSGSINENIWIVGNDVDGDMQLTAGGQAGVRNVWILSNRLKNGRSNGIAMTTSAHNALFENIHISDNTIEDVVGNGIFVGPDGGGGAMNGTMRQVTITGNIIRGFQEALSNVGIHLRAHATNQDIVVAHNTISSATQLGQNTFGIYIVNSEAPVGTRWFENLVLEGNTVRSFTWGLALRSVKESRVEGNKMTGCAAGLLAHTCSSLAIDGNVVNACRAGIELTDSRSVVLINNLVKNSKAGDLVEAALYLQADAGAYFPTVEVFAYGNKFFDDQAVKTQNYAVWQIGDGTFDTHFIHNDLRGNISGPFQVDAGAIATRSQNLGDSGVNATPARHLSATATLDFDLSLASSQDITVNVAGAMAGDTVSLGVPPVSVTADTLYSAWVSAPDIVTVRALRVAGNPNPPEGVFRVSVLSY